MIEVIIFAAEVLKHQLPEAQRATVLLGLPQAYANAEGAACGFPSAHWWPFATARSSLVELKHGHCAQMTNHDTELVALIDNELDGGAKARLLTRLAQDEAMRERYEALREAGRLIVIALDALLQKAPLSQFRAWLPPEDARRAPSGRLSGIGLTENGPLSDAR
jgi:hypothetical protein